MADLTQLLTPPVLGQGALGSEDVLDQSSLFSKLDEILGRYYEPRRDAFEWPCWVKVKVQMRKDDGEVQTASYLPYVLVSREFGSEEWRVVSTGSTPLNGVVWLPVVGFAELRAYVKEPGVDFTPGAVFEIPQHALAEGGESGREVQPWLCLGVWSGATDDTETWELIQELPNDFGRAATDYPSPSTGTLTAQHRDQSKAFNLGNYVITRQLWADASRVYGADHPTVAASEYRALLEQIYQEQLTPNGNDLVLDAGLFAIEFDAQATNGGITTQTFLEEGGLMSRSESLRRTHPSVFEWWFRAMEALGIHYARVTGAWRPHVGSTRHRYASALDLTHLRTWVPDGSNDLVEVEIHLHRDDTAANPLASGADVDTPEKVRKRDFSLRFHTYLAERRMAQELNWLGGPWALTYANVGLPGNTTFIHTDAIHVHHVHLSVGSDQPG